jgi:hypothetical protein
MAQGYLREWSTSALPVLGIGVLMAALGYGLMPTDPVSATGSQPAPTAVVAPATQSAPVIEHVSLEVDRQP